MKRWQRMLVLIPVLLAVLVIAGSALALAAPRAVVGPQAATAAYDLSWDVIASGGATMSSSSYIMHSTAGQPVIGQSQGGSYTLLHGYWADLRDFINDLLLPVVLRP